MYAHSPVPPLASTAGEGTSATGLSESWRQQDPPYYQTERRHISEHLQTPATNVDI